MERRTGEEAASSIAVIPRTTVLRHGSTSLFAIMIERAFLQGSRVLQYEEQVTSKKLADQTFG